MFSKALSTAVKAILPYQPMSIATHTTGMGGERQVTKCLKSLLIGCLITHQLLDPGPYFLGWEYHTLSWPMTQIRQLLSFEDTLSTAQRGAEKRETLLRMRKLRRHVIFS